PPMAAIRLRHLGQSSHHASRPALRCERGARHAPHHDRRRRADARAGGVAARTRLDHALHGTIGALAASSDDPALAECERLLRTGDAALAAQRGEDAAAAFEAAAALAPGDHRPWIYLARARLARRQTRAALDALRKAAAAHRRSTATLVELAELCREHRLWAEAEKWCHAALAEDAACSEAWLC